MISIISNYKNVYIYYEKDICNYCYFGAYDSAFSYLFVKFSFKLGPSHLASNSLDALWFYVLINVNPQVAMRVIWFHYWKAQTEKTHVAIKTVIWCPLKSQIQLSNFPKSLSAYAGFSRLVFCSWVPSD